MRRSSVVPAKKLSALLPRIKIWLETDGDYAFGFGLCQMLQAVERAGSIKQAARDLGKSYRYIWGRIKEAEQALGQRLVETQVGGKDVQRSFLTAIAKDLVRDFLSVRERLSRLAEQEFRDRFRWPIRSRT